MEASLAGERNGSRPPSYEVNPYGYIKSVREFARQSESKVLKVAPNSVVADMEAEVEQSELFAAEEAAHLIDDRITPEVAGWIAEGFTNTMERLVKLSAFAKTHEADVIPFGELDEETKAGVRKTMFAQYVEMCETLAGPTSRGPSKMAYRQTASVYYSPEEAGYLIDVHADLGRSNVARTICQKPISAEAFLEEARELIETATSEFPTVPPAEVRNRVMRGPRSYKKALQEYAEQHGLRTDTPAVEVSSQDPDTFLQTLRRLLRSEGHATRRKGSHPQEIFETAQTLGREALALLDEVETVEGMDPEATQNPVLRLNFQKKAQQLILASHQAWRRGELEFSPDQASPEFRRALYTRMLGDFLQIHVQLGGSIADVPLRENPVLYYDPASVARIVANNPDLLPSHIRQLILRHPDAPEEAMDEFRTKAEAIVAANPRVMRHEAMRAIIRNSFGGVEPSAEDTEHEPIEPAALIEELRPYLIGHGEHLRKNIAQDIRDVIEARRPEIAETFEAAGWTFDGMTIPETARPILIHKIEDFLIANERAYNTGEVPGRLRDYDSAERTSVYVMIAENYGRLGQLMGSKTAKDWQANPALCIDADELERLRAQYDWVEDWGVHRLAGTNGLVDMTAAFSRSDEARRNLELWYPGLAGSFIKDTALIRPGSAHTVAMPRIRAKAEEDYKRTFSRQYEPSPHQPSLIYKHIRTMAKEGTTPKGWAFETETQSIIDAFMAKAEEWLEKYGTAGEIDDQERDKFLRHVEYCVGVTEALWQEDGSYPSIIRLPHQAQHGFLKSIYSNQAKLHDLLAEVNVNGGQQFRMYAFGFNHDAKYLKALWKQYEAYMPKQLITFAALTSPARPIDRLNDLVEYRANLLMQHPELDRKQVIQALAAQARKG